MGENAAADRKRGRVANQTFPPAGTEGEARQAARAGHNSVGAFRAFAPVRTLTREAQAGVSLVARAVARQREPFVRGDQ